MWGIAPRLLVELEAGVSVEDLIFQQSAVGRGLPEGHDHGSVTADELNGQPRKGLQVSQNIPDPGFRHKGENTIRHAATSFDHKS